MQEVYRDQIKSVLYLTDFTSLEHGAQENCHAETHLTSSLVITRWNSAILKTLWMARAAIMFRITSRSSSSPMHYSQHSWMYTITDSVMQLSHISW